MKVCLVTSYYPPYIGGIETYTKSLGEALAGRGHDVTVYCSSRGSSTGASTSGGIRVVRFRTPLVLYGAPIGPFPLSFLEEGFDVIHGNFPNPYFAAVSSWVGSLRGIPAVLTWHNDLPAVTRSASLLVGAHDLLSPLYLHPYRRIIATTSAYACRSKTLLKYSQKVTVVSNGVDTSRFSPAVPRGPVRERYGMEGAFVVLFVGALTRWHTYKGLDVLIEAFARACKECQSMRLMVVGDGALAGSYASLARSLKIQERVVFTGRADDADLPHYYSASDVTVLPSKNASEGFGLVLLEAMACGKPVIGTSVGGIPELIRDGENGLLVGPNDSEALARSLTTMYKLGEKRVEMGASGRGFAELRDWRIVAERVESVYESSRTHGQ